MFSQFFGQYLLKRKLISPAQLRFVLTLQNFDSVRLGIMAIELGFMTSGQVKEVHAVQAKVDKRFGEIAVDAGYLTREQLQILLTGQTSLHVSISQTLVDEGIMDLETLWRILEEYKRDCGFTQAEFQALEAEDIDTLAQALAQALALGRMPALGDQAAYSGYLALFARNLMRFVDRNFVLEHARPVGEFPFELLVHQRLLGLQDIFTGVAGPRAAVAGFVERYAKLESPGPELIGDGLGEFLNVHNGLFATNISNNHVKLDLDVPRFHTGGTLRLEGALYTVPFNLPFGEFHLLVGCGEPRFS